MEATKNYQALNILGLARSKAEGAHNEFLKLISVYHRNGTALLCKMRTIFYI
jgi:hypothetical protein